MDIHEYQAKEILARFGVPVPRGGLAYSPEQASYRTREIGGSGWVVKAQVHSGGRGEAGRVVLCHSDREVTDAANRLFGTRLVTRQAPDGKLVNRVYVEEASRIARELYFGIVLDRATDCVTVVAAAEGGTAIEELAPRSRRRCCAPRSSLPSGSSSSRPGRSRSLSDSTRRRSRTPRGSSGARTGPSVTWT